MWKTKSNQPKICCNCAHCVYIGEGDYICDVDEPILVMEDHMPNENFCACNECDWEEQ